MKTPLSYPYTDQWRRFKNPARQEIVQHSLSDTPHHLPFPCDTFLPSMSET